MDRISALRNVEDALAAFEEGETDLAGLERRVRGVLRTYATEFEADAAGLATYRVAGTGEEGNEREEGTIVVAGDRTEARKRARALLEAPGDGLTVERLGGADAGAE